GDRPSVVHQPGNGAHARGPGDAQAARQGPRAACRLRGAVRAHHPSRAVTRPDPVSRTPSYVLGLLVVGAMLSVASYSTGLRVCVMLFMWGSVEPAAKADERARRPVDVSDAVQQPP